MRQFQGLRKMLNLRGNEDKVVRMLILQRHECAALTRASTFAAVSCHATKVSEMRDDFCIPWQTSVTQKGV